MDINQNQQTNTFVKGMNTDTSDMYLSSDQYRYAENVRIVTNIDNNAGELRIVEGNKLIYIKDKYDGSIKGTILAANSIRNIGIVIIKETIGNNWSIYKFTKELDNQNLDIFRAIRIFGPCEYSFAKPIKSIDTVLRWESDANIKLYICSGEDKTPLWVLKFDNNFTEQPSEIPNSIDYFKQSSIFIPSPQVEIANVPGYIKGPVVQYSYRLYTENGVSTNISSLSKLLSLYASNTKGVLLDKLSNKAVKITIPTLNTSGLDKILIYRVSYQQLGMEPVIDKILDADYIDGNFSFIDYGYSVSSLSLAEYQSMAKTILFPKSIESKGDYLFYGNISYAEDSVNKEIEEEEIDVRCFSRGSYTIDLNNNKIYIIQDDTVTLPRDINTKVYNDAFDNSGHRNTNWDYWDPVGEYNGVGKNFKWKFVHTPVTLTTENQTNNLEESYRTYRRGEVYRFGVRLFNNEGYSSSVKWMCDIQIPDSDETPAVTIENGTMTADCVSIQFEPVNMPSTITGYEIVQCIRTINDKYTISQGLVGALSSIKKVNVSGDLNDRYLTGNLGFKEHTGYLMFNGFVTLDDIYARTHKVANAPVIISGLNVPINIDTYQIITHDEMIAVPYDKAVIFASPEYCYQPDDIKNIIELYDISHMSLLFKHSYIPRRKQMEPGGDLYIVTPDDPTADRRRWDPDYYFTAFASTMFAGDIPSYSLGYKGDKNSTVTIQDGTTYYPWYYGDLQRWTSREMAAYFYDMVVGLYNNGVHFQSEGSINDTAGNDDEDNGINLYLTNSQLIPYGFKNPNLSSSNYYNFWYTKGSLNTTSYTGTTLDGVFFTDENESSGKHYLNLFIPYAEESLPFTRRPVVGTRAQNINLTTLDDVEYIDSADPTKFRNNNVTAITSSVYGVDSLQFINWSELFYPAYNAIGKSDSTVYNNGQKYLSINNNTDNQDHIAPENALYYPVSAGGKYMIFHTPQDVPNESASPYPPSIYIYNLDKNAVPYQGYNEAAIKNSRYILVGGGQSIDQPVTINGGDSFIKIFTYNAGHDWYSAGVHNAVHMASIYMVPIETDIDLQGQYSDALFIGKSLQTDISKGKKSYYIQDEPFTVQGYVQDTASYMYNTAYNIQPDVFSYYQDRTTKGDTNNYDTRVHYSNRKLNNESIDNWSTTMPMNFLDVDSRYGLITNLKLFKDKLIFWQEHATGVLSVNERLLITTEDDAKLSLGYGGVLDRFDYMSTIYGMKEGLRVCTESNTTLYWWDYYQKELLAYGEHFIPLTEVKNVRNYINKNNNTNTPHLFYDNKYKELIANVVGNKSLVYNENIQQFTSVYTYQPLFNFNIDGEIYTTLSQIETISKTNDSDDGLSSAWNGTLAKPLVEYVVNGQPTYNKTFDVQTFGGRFYGGNDNIKNLSFTYKTPLKQEGRIEHVENEQFAVTNREYDFRLAIPRAGYEDNGEWKIKEYGDRLRGKTILCKIESSSNGLDFALLYVTTKFRMSWT